jgi:encapsulating protein for peroxidase/Dyp-type peroxidase family protein
MPFGNVSTGDAGTYFIGYACSPARIEKMLEHMVIGNPPGNYDRMLDFTHPVTEHIRRLVNGEIMRAPAIAGAFVPTTRGGDFALHIGQDVSIGYLEHTNTAVRLYLQETFTFLFLTHEAAVALNPANAAIATSV